ncbi:MAG TPA: thioesterase family protein [Bacteroidota bacterium]|nr:thioesterase family protein [Bacteroidota bacterium]
MTQLRVRSYEVDWQGIVHNTNYLRFFEVGRIDYLKHIGATVDMKSIQGHGKVVLVRNEIDYRAPAFFDESLNVYSRISVVKNTSFVIEGFMERISDRQIISTNVAVHVWLDPETNRPRMIPDEFRRLVQQYEGDACQIFWPSAEV